MMRNRAALGSLAALALLLLTSAAPGCVGLLLTREAIEGVRGPAQTVEVDEISEISHTFESLSPVPHYNSGHIDVDEHTVWLRVHFQTSMIGGFVENYTGHGHYIRAWVENPNGSVVFDLNATGTSKKPSKLFVNPIEGRWEYHIEARGYGINLGGISQKDQYLLVVTRTQLTTTFD